MKYTSTYHESPDSLLLQQLLFLPLFSLHSGMVVEDCLAQSGDLPLVVTMELLKVSTVLQDAVQVLLKRGGEGEVVNTCPSKSSCVIPKDKSCLGDTMGQPLASL